MKLFGEKVAPNNQLHRTRKQRHFVPPLARR
jgi:hypothetical protein